MENSNMFKVLVIDNFDSFTYNLVDDFCKRNCDTKVYRSNTPLEDIIKISGSFDTDLLVLSPGPGNPDTAGITLAAIDYFKDKLPIFGVCLGHQAIIQYFGGQVGHAPKVVHGKPSKISHNQNGIFQDIENPMQAGRYHSLVGTVIPDCLEITAQFESIVMAAQHKELPIYSVQFHPESILTPCGGKVIENVLNLARKHKQENKK